MAILIPDDPEHFARLSIRLDPPRDDLQIGAARRTATSDESSVDANDHLLRWLIKFSSLGYVPSNLFVDALSNGDDPASGGSMGSSAHRWEEQSQHIRGLAIRNLRSQAHLQVTQVGRRSTREDSRNRVPNLGAAVALTMPISRNPQTHGPQHGIQASAAVVFNRSQPATGETFSPLFTMLLQLLFYYGVLQTVHNLLRFLQIDSEVIRCGTAGEPFNRAQYNRGFFAIFSDALQYDVPAHALLVGPTLQRTMVGGIPVKTPSFFPVPI